MRAVAAALVLLNHAAAISFLSVTASYRGLVAHLSVGVAVFFVISGFLLYRPFVAAHLADKAPPATLRFFRRRALRIIPAYWLALTVLAIWPGLPGVFTDQWWRYYFFLQIYGDPIHALGGIEQAWSLCVEVSFYLLLPFYAAGVRRWLGGEVARRLPRELLVLLALSLGSLAVRAALLGGSGRLVATLPTHMLWFAVGMAMALLSAAPQWAPRMVRLLGDHALACWGLAAAIYLAGSWLTTPALGYLTLSHNADLATYVMNAVVAGLLLAPAVFAAPRSSAPTRFLGLRPVAWLGLVSYGVFLWHVKIIEQLAHQGVWTWFTHPALTFVALAVLGLALSTAVAAASYYGAEERLLRFKDPRRSPQADQSS